MWRNMQEQGLFFNFCSLAEAKLKKKKRLKFYDKLIPPRCTYYFKKTRKVVNFLFFKYFLTSSPQDKLIDNILRIIWKIKLKQRTAFITKWIKFKNLFALQ